MTNNIFKSISQRLIFSMFSIGILVFFSNELLLLLLARPIDATLTFKSAKLASLIVMNIQGEREIDQIVSKHDAGLSGFLSIFYKVVRAYVWIAVLLTFLSIFFPSTPVWVDAYLVNFGLLAPAIVYGIPNYRCAHNQLVPEKIRQHMGWFLYFLNMPMTVSIAAFLTSTYFLIGASPGANDARYFIGGAAALLLFLIHALTVCIDQHANVALYKAVPRGVDPTKPARYLVISWVLVASGLGILGLLFAFDASTAARVSGRIGIGAGTGLIMLAFSADGWRGFRFSILVGILYAFLAASVLRIVPLTALETALEIAAAGALVVLLAGYGRFALSKKLISLTANGLLSLATPVLVLLCLLLLFELGRINLVATSLETKAFWLANVILGMDLLVEGAWFGFIAIGSKFSRIS